MHTGADVGGTFTDVAVWDGQRLRTSKVPSTADQSEGVIAGIAAIDANPGTLLHGTTVATNALLERSGARTVLVTDAGFEDLIEIGRQDRPSLYDTTVVRTEPIADRASPGGGGGASRSPRSQERAAGCRRRGRPGSGTRPRSRGDLAPVLIRGRRR